MKYPIGIQSFVDIREDGYAYVDKTAAIYEMASKGKYYFLSRPRRFGKSLLLSTMKAYFLGKRELFDGLAIAQLEKEWKQYPVLHLDLNTAKYTTANALVNLLEYHLAQWEKEYNIDKENDDLSVRFRNVITRTAQQAETKKVVVLVDEYDKPLLEAIGKPELQEEYRQTLKAFYANIKSCDEHIRFAFLTGVTKFSHLTIFSGLNNLKDISLDKYYTDICGITLPEIESTFAEGVKQLAQSHSVTYEEMIQQLKLKYDGYHFSSDTSTDIYNPFSLLNALDSSELKSYWFATGTPNFLVEVLRQTDYPLDRLTTEEVDAVTMDTIDVMYRDPMPLLFQSGYLTIKAYDPEFMSYRLGFPNKEVEEGFAKFMTAYFYAGDGSDSFSIRKFVEAVRDGDPEGFMKLMQAFFADGDYQLTGKLEIYFQNSLLMLFKLMGFYVQVERHTSNGRMDVTIQTQDYIYIVELKVDKSAEVALQQIEDKHYAEPFGTDSRKLYKIGVSFSSKTRKIEEYKIVEG